MHHAERGGDLLIYATARMPASRSPPSRSASPAGSSDSDDYAALLAHSAVVRIPAPALARLRSALVREQSDAAEPEPPARTASSRATRTYRNPRTVENDLRDLSMVEDTMRLRLIADIEAKRRCPPDASSAEAKRARRQQRRRVSDPSPLLADVHFVSAQPVQCDCGRPHILNPRRFQQAEGMTTAFAMAAATCRETIACGACGCWLLRNTDLLPPEEMACAVGLTDSSTTLCAKQANVIVGEEAMYERQSADTWKYTMADVSCPSCEAFLGVKILSATPIVTQDPFGTHLADFEGRAGCYIKSPSDSWVHAAMAAAIPSPPASELWSPRWHGETDDFETASEGSSQWTESEASSSEYSSEQSSSGSDLTDDEDTLPMVRVRRRARSEEDQMDFDMDDEESARMAGGGGGGSDDGAGDRATSRRRSTGCVGQGLRQVGCAFRSRVRRRRRAAAAAVAAAGSDGMLPDPAPMLPSTPPNSSLHYDISCRTPIELEVNQIHIGLRYVRILDAQRGGIPKCPPGEIRCCAVVQDKADAEIAGGDEPAASSRLCGNVLSYSDQILCTDRCWGFRSQAPEPSFYINSLRPGSYKQSNLAQMRLGQGIFGMMDVVCQDCNSMVGYKFVSSANSANRNHIGRAGLVLSCISLPRG